MLHLTALDTLRRQCTGLMAEIKPFGQEYVHIMKLKEAIDDHQYFWTQDRKYFYCKGSNGGTGLFDSSQTPTREKAAPGGAADKS